MAKRLTHLQKGIRRAKKSGLRSLKTAQISGLRSLKSARKSGQRALKQAKKSGLRSLKTARKSGRRELKRALKTRAVKNVRAAVVRGVVASGFAGPQRDRSGRFKNLRGTRAGITVKENPLLGLIRAAANIGASGFSITVGVHAREGSEGYQGGLEGETIADIASEHELGLGVPERSFIRAYCDANAAQIESDLKAAMRKVFRGKLRIDQAAALVGMKHAGGIQRFISSGQVTPPLSEYTIAKKGSSTPLIDTGQLRSAITYTVSRRYL